MNLEEKLQEALRGILTSSIGAAGALNLASTAAIVSGLLHAKVITPPQAADIFRHAADLMSGSSVKDDTLASHVAALRNFADLAMRVDMSK